MSLNGRCYDMFLIRKLCTITHIKLHALRTRPVMFITFSEFSSPSAYAYGTRFVDDISLRNIRTYIYVDKIWPAKYNYFVV